MSASSPRTAYRVWFLPCFGAGSWSRLLLKPSLDVSEQSYLVHVRLVNASRKVQTLRWDVSRSPYLALPTGKTIWPTGHALYGLSENSLAVKGVLEVEVPARGSYDLHPIFVGARLPAGTRLVIDKVGRARVPL